MKIIITKGHKPYRQQRLAEHAVWVASIKGIEVEVR